MIKFNINQHVYFKPTDVGLKLMQDWYNPEKKMFDEQRGMYYLQMWEFMSCFGEKCFAGGSNFIVDCVIYMENNHCERIDGFGSD